MTEEKHFTAHDLEIASKLGALTTAIQNLQMSFDSAIELKNDEYRRIWSRLADQDKELSKQNGLIKWMIGIGVGVNLAWGAIVIFIKGH